MRTLLIRLSIALLAYPISKIIFFVFNHNYFADVSLAEFVSTLFWGLRFDLAALVIINAPFILLHIIPIQKNWYQAVLKTVFIIFNSIAILADCIDLIYFRFTLKRTTADFFDLFGLGSDITSLLPQYIRDFWYVILIWIAITFFIAWLYGKTKRPLSYLPEGQPQVANPVPIARSNSFRWGRQGLTWASWLILNSIFIGLCVITFRGGLQLRPIMPINASEYVDAKNIPLIVNTPFSLIKSSDLEKLKEKNYYSETELPKIFDPIHKARSSTRCSNPNIFIIILESFSKEYVGALSGKKTYTPFLDSLIEKSMVFNNAFANGKKSIEGIPAILASLPALTNESFITSSYGSNRFTSIPNTLKTQKYSTAFFHGGTNGTMGFDAFCSAAGFDKYYGRSEYNNEKDYDGDWGIWDEEFFQYTNNTVSQMKEPFLSVLFTLSSHHPSFIPEKYKTKFTGGDLPILKSVEYADFSLRKFFESASKETWFDSTLFIITADHTGPSNDSYYNNNAGRFQIPIIMYKQNSAFNGTNQKTVQHIDILPTILNYLNYTEDYFSFGNDMLDSTNAGYAVNFTNDVYQLFEDDHLLQFDGNNTIALYNYKTDPLLQSNLIGKELDQEKQMETKLKAIIQTYYHGMIHNKMTSEKTAGAKQ